MSLDERVILFIKLASGVTEIKLKEIKSTIRGQLSARHVPALILPIRDIPYTISGKKVEVAVRDIVAGKKVAYTRVETFQIDCVFSMHNVIRL